MIEQSEAAKLMEEFPELQRFSNRLRLINELKADAAQEDSLELMKDSYESVLRLYERLYAELIIYISDEHEKQFQALFEICNERMRIIEMLESMLKKAYGIDEIDIVAPVKAKRQRHLKIVKK